MAKRHHSGMSKGSWMSDDKGAHGCAPEGVKRMAVGNAMGGELKRMPDLFEAVEEQMHETGRQLKKLTKPVKW